MSITRLPFFGPMQTARLALAAMATRFELVLHGSDAMALRAAGEAALAEIRRLEEALSFYRPTSELSRLNRRAAAGPVTVTPQLFGLLRHARKLHSRTNGAFDVTIGPLMKCWGFTGSGGARPTEDAIERARSVTGMGLVEMDAARRTVRYQRAGVQIDLGAIGKGFAIEEAISVLRSCGIEHAFLHGGTSSMAAMGRPPGESAWKVAVAVPESDQVAAVVHLSNEALSVSAPSGKAFREGSSTYGHVLDPRAGRPVQRARLAAVVHASPTVCDALSTALLVLGCGEPVLVNAFGNRIRTLVFCGTEEHPELITHGIKPLLHARQVSHESNGQGQS